MPTPRSIVCTPDTCGGSPRIADVRLTCANVVLALNGQFSLDEYLAVYTELTAADLKHCLDYCAHQKCLYDHPLHYCQRCTLDDRADSMPQSILNDQGEIVANPFADENSPNHLFLGTLEQLKKDQESIDIWLLARDLLATIQWPDELRP